MSVNIDEKQIAIIARVIHAANREFCATHGDFSLSDWAATSDEIKHSVIDGVVNRLKNPATTPEQSHENWMKFKEGQGWKYGPEKNEELKTHPAMLPYEQLPAHQKQKDHIFNAIVDALTQTV